ncbi:hypothetical protein LOK49_Contig115G00001 [Camellia lanceoleosa]|nr:hypothetical protein LOK49_Contig115G00001 [Camellia lanceoleosa]
MFAASCACDACRTVVSGISRRSARIAYCGLFALSLIVSWILREVAALRIGPHLWFWIEVSMAAEDSDCFTQFVSETLETDSLGGEAKSVEIGLRQSKAELGSGKKMKMRAEIDTSAPFEFWIEVSMAAEDSDCFTQFVSETLETDSL